MNLFMSVLGALLLGAGPAHAAAPGMASATAYPSGDSIPENLLRIELRFSKPQRRPIDLQHVKLLDSDGAEIDAPFLDLPLPSADGSRVAILLHPGRLKSGVRANAALGRALHAGSSVTLVFDDPHLANAMRKAWRVVAADERSPAPLGWSFHAPVSGVRSPLLLQLDQPLAASAEGLIAIRAADGSRLEGRSELLHGETQWRFVPEQPWKAGAYAIVVHPDLEDPAGNRVCSTFEAPLGVDPVCAQGAARPFRVGARSHFEAGER